MGIAEAPPDQTDALAERLFGAFTRLLIVPLALCALALAPSIAEAASRVSGDFNGDGLDDLAVGLPTENVGSVVDAGAVNVIYGSPNRLTADGNQLWHQDTAGVADAAEANDNFGFSLAAGDFQGDGFDDLAVGVRLEDLGFLAERAGAVNVIYGSQNGLAEAGNQLWHQDSTGIADAAETGDFFGSSLAAGDFNGSGHDDLVVGAEFENVGSLVNAGAVNAIYGAGVGLRANGNQIWHQNSTGIADVAEDSDQFGSALAAGDFNGNGFDDLAVGVRVEGVGAVLNAGAVNAIYGSQSRLTATGNQLWHQDTTGIADAAEDSDQFGSALAAGDFNGNGFDDLAVGVWQEGVGSVASAGAVNAIYGAGVGLRANGNQLWHQDRTGIADAAQDGDRLGSSLTAGDFQGDGFDDLAVGVRAEEVGSVEFAGAANAIYGTPNRLTATGNQLWHQDSTGIADASEFGDNFGFALTSGDFNGSGHDDLVVGVPFEDVVVVRFGGSASILDAGAANVVYGSGGSALRARDNQIWHQDSPGSGDEAEGIEDAVELGDSFGFSLPG